MATTLRVKRRVTGDTGAPAALKSAEIAYNMADGGLYVGFGDDGSGNATSVKKFAGDNFLQNLPTPVTGKILGVSGGVWAAIDAPAGGGTYTPGAGLTLSGTEFAVNYTLVAERTWVSSNFAPTVHQHSAADITSGVFDPARLPASVFQAPIVAATNTPALQPLSKRRSVPGPRSSLQMGVSGPTSRATRPWRRATARWPTPLRSGRRSRTGRHSPRSPPRAPTTILPGGQPSARWLRRTRTPLP